MCIFEYTEEFLTKNVIRTLLLLLLFVICMLLLLLFVIYMLFVQLTCLLSIILQRANFLLLCACVCVFF